MRWALKGRARHSGLQVVGVPEQFGVTGGVEGLEGRCRGHVEHAADHPHATGGGEVRTERRRQR